MEETKRQKQVAQLVMEEMNDVFRREGINMVKGGMVSISKVSVTPDLLEARIYLSLFQIEDQQELILDIKARTPELRNQLGIRVRHQLRRIPYLSFFLDDTLDHVFKMEELLKSVRQDPKPDTEEEQ